MGDLHEEVSHDSVTKLKMLDNTDKKSTGIIMKVSVFWFWFWGGLMITVYNLVLLFCLIMVSCLLSLTPTFSRLTSLSMKLKLIHIFSRLTSLSMKLKLIHIFSRLTSLLMKIKLLEYLTRWRFKKGRRKKHRRDIGSKKNLL